MEQRGNIRTCSKELRQPVPEDPFEKIEAILIRKLIGSTIELNSASATSILKECC